jgi:hypothetical protein
VPGNKSWVSSQSFQEKNVNENVPQRELLSLRPWEMVKGKCVKSDYGIECRQSKVMSS